jgi:hypothetical protein
MACNLLLQIRVNPNIIMYIGQRLKNFIIRGQ